MEEVRTVLQAFQTLTHAPGGKCAIACFKRALLRTGVITSAAVAEGTQQLSASEAERFDEAFEAVQCLARQRIGAPWATAPGVLEPPRVAEGVR